MKPIIALTPNLVDYDRNLKLNDEYCKAIWEAGGIPIIISYNEGIIEILNNVQGILFTGGGDIDPLLMNEEPIKELGEVSPIRDNIELLLCREALKLNLPILGICRGCQVLAIASGGKVYQDIYVNHHTSLKHSQNGPKYYPSHKIELKSNTKLESIYKSNEIKVNSFHHQAVSSLNDNMIVAATSSDGIIEAIEHKSNKFVLGVQWHPESMFEKYKEQRNLFNEFVFNCKLD